MEESSPFPRRRDVTLSGRETRTMYVLSVFCVCVFVCVPVCVVRCVSLLFVYVFLCIARAVCHA